MRILYHAINGSGLGHLHRITNIASEVKKLESNIYQLILTTCPVIDYPRSLSIPCIVVPESDQSATTKLEKRARTISKKSQEQIVTQAVNTIKADIIVYDTYAEKNIIKQTKKLAKQVLVFRQCKEEYLKKRLSENMFKSFDKILIPHIEDDFSRYLEKSTFKEFKRKVKPIFVGPIVQSQIVKNIKNSEIKLKYPFLHPQSTLLIVAGGGGYLGKVEKFYRKAIEAANQLRIRRIITNIVILLGPHTNNLSSFSKTIPHFLVTHEYNLPLLANESLVVISTAGYNSVHELLSTGTPCLFVPSERHSEDQRSNIPNIKKIDAPVSIISLHEPIKTWVYKLRKLCEVTHRVPKEFTGGVKSAIEISKLIESNDEDKKIRLNNNNDSNELDFQGKIFELGECTLNKLVNSILKLINYYPNSKHLSFVYNDDPKKPILYDAAKVLQCYEFDWLIARIPLEQNQTLVGEQLNACRLLRPNFKVDATTQVKKITSINRP